ncbi:Protein GET1 [Linum perenne]
MEGDLPMEVDLTMEVDEDPVQQRRSFVAPLIFSVVVLFQLASRRIEILKRKASKSEKEVQLRVEIKQLYKEASTFSQPSTFAQAAKLRRLAAAKEKELANYQESQGKEVKMSYDLYLKILFLLKVVTYAVLISWFWRAPIAVVSQQLVQPFVDGLYLSAGKILSWTAGGNFPNNVAVIL